MLITIGSLPPVKIRYNSGLEYSKRHMLNFMEGIKILSLESVIRFWLNLLVGFRSKFLLNNIRPILMRCGTEWYRQKTMATCLLLDRLPMKEVMLWLPKEVLFRDMLTLFSM